MKFRCLRYGMQQNINERQRLIYEMLRNAEAKTTECY